MKLIIVKTLALLTLSQPCVADFTPNRTVVTDFAASVNGLLPVDLPWLVENFESQILPRAHEMLQMIMSRGQGLIPMGASPLVAGLEKEEGRRLSKIKGYAKSEAQNKKLRGMPVANKQGHRRLGAPKCKNSKKGGETCTGDAFKLFIGITPLGDPISGFETELGDTGAIGGLFVGLEITFAKNVDPLDSLDFEDFVEDILDSIVDVEVMIGFVTGTATAVGQEPYYVATYVDLGIDYIKFSLDFFDFDFECEPLVELSQIRSAGSLVNTPFGDPGILPITGTSFSLAGHVGGGNMLLYTDIDDDWPLFTLGFLPLTTEAACNQNQQINNVIVALQSIIVDMF